ncbi:MAG: hypothetical protein CL918_03750 [Deltaproteobacteria bacterium]|nr:hypothetical protein [Deltaproteobacteria bacterium]
MKTLNPLEQLLYTPSLEQTRTQHNHPYEKGMFISINNHKTDSLDPHSFRIDKKERCFVISQNYGEVMLADTPRFWLLNHLNESGSYFVFGKKHFPLAYHE